MRRCAGSLLALLLLPQAAAAVPKPAVLIAGQVEGATATLASVNARSGQRVTLWAVMRIGTRYYTDAPALTINGRALPASRLRPLRDLSGHLAFRWLQVEPEPHHVRLPPPNPGNVAYSNAVLFGKNHGRWLGYDHIEYGEKLLESERGSSLTLRRVLPSNPKVNVHGGLGTMRFKVVITADGQQYSSAGMEAASQRGILPSVMRITFRDGDDLVGWMTAYFNVPNVFGSGGNGRTHQAELFQGADCADVITGAARLAGSKMAYTSVMGFRRYARPITPVLLLEESGIYELQQDGAKGARVELAFGRDIRRGDIMLIDYVGFADSPRGWDHVGIVARDQGRRGMFDPHDTVMHMGYLYGLVEAEAHTEGPARVQFLRFRNEFLRHKEPALAHR